MKRTTGFILAIFLVIVAAVVILATFDFNRFNKDNLYVQIDELVEVEETVLDSGEIIQRYWYVLPAFDEEGDETIVEFSSANELRTDAYLMLYVSNEDDVTSYDEVEWDDIPLRAQEKIEG